MTNYKLRALKRFREALKWEYSDEELGYVYDELLPRLSVHGINDNKHQAYLQALLVFFNNASYTKLSMQSPNSRFVSFSVLVSSFDDIEFSITKDRLDVQLTAFTVISIPWKSIQSISPRLLQLKIARSIVNFTFSERN